MQGAWLPQLLKPVCPRACALPIREASATRILSTATQEQPHFTATRESLHAVMTTQRSQKLINKLKKNITRKNISYFSRNTAIIYSSQQ